MHTIDLKIYWNFQNVLLLIYCFTVDEVVNVAHSGIMLNSGQVCSAASRTFVHEKIYDEFVKKSAEKAKARTVGDPFSEIQQGAMVCIMSRHRGLNFKLSPI